MTHRQRERMRMEIIIEADGEHTCCGREVTRYQRVTWTYLTTRDGRFFQTMA